MIVEKNNIVKRSDFLWEIPKTFRKGMKVKALIFATEKMLDEVFRDRSLEQLVNVASLPGIQGSAIAMPDMHEGYGFPIGAVAAFSYPDGIISPGGIGYDINCGVRLLKSNLSYDEGEPYFERLAKELYQAVPSGVGRGGQIKLDNKMLDDVLKEGIGFLESLGYAQKNDRQSIESNGVLSNADPSVVSDHAKERGRDQLGTMGAGNHFVEVDRVDAIFDKEKADTFGLKEDQIVILIHTGSRGLGHQVATDNIAVMLKNAEKYGIELPDRELACAPLSTFYGKTYFNAMAAAANFAWANRQMITSEVRSVFRKIFGETQGQLSVLYDVAHNIAKVEEHEINGRRKRLIVHRKGATRAFPNQPVIIPGSMGTASYVLVGTKESMKESFGSACHGAGRRMSRHAAKKEIQGKKLSIDLKKMGIFVETGSVSGLSEEAPLAYKDIEDVVNVVDQTHLAKRVARLKPVVVIKG